MDEYDALKATTGGGISFMGLLTITFIVLKLTDVIDWSWLWVLAPMWGTIVFLILMTLILAAVIKITKQ